MAVKTVNESRKASTFNALVEHDSENGKWIDGNVYTFHGIVRVYSDQYNTCISTITGGREYWRQITGRTYSSRGLVALAGRFARECAKKDES